MTYGNRMPTPEAVTAAASDRQARRRRGSGGARRSATAARVCRTPGGPTRRTDDVVFRLPDPEHELDGVRLEVDWILGDIDPEFTWADG